ncbi:MAG: hypothetical protein K8S15_06505 [Candidatus Aegiribacteria sp.]|nr:hypothetical protein [Candidatus Aegiribacteria sp.]
MKRTILIVLCLASVGVFAIAHAQDDTNTSDCDNCISVDGTCCCDETVDGCTGDCDDCNECDCDSESEECTDCEKANSDCDDCTECDSNHNDCASEEAVVRHCGGCR